jgi:hypothetical protein
MTSPEFEALSPGLPSHRDEVMTGHPGQPSVEEQDATHGAGAPVADHGTDDRGKLTGGYR